MKMSSLPLPCPRILLSFFTLLLSCFPFLVISLSPHSEKAILLSIKQQWGNQPPMQSWNFTTSHCNWHGINCTGASGGEIVSGINLNSQNIDGKIPPTICDLKNLTSLDLGFNNIPGNFPTLLYNCTKLQTLDLSSNYFVGKLPDDINKLSPDLQHFDFGINNFTGNIPSSLAQLKGLISLHLDSNLFNGTFPSELGSLENIEELWLAYNPFSPVKLPKEFGMLRSLKSLVMPQCNLIGVIPNDFANLTSLQRLDIADNDLVGEIPSWLFLLNDLTYLYLYGNRLSGEIPSSIKAFNLTEIDLSDNNLTGIIPKEIGKLSKLEDLYLERNQFFGTLPPSIGLLPSLNALGLSNNSFSGPLPQELGLHSKIKYFYVSNNAFSGQLPVNLCSGGKLLYVVAYNNYLNGTIAATLGSLPHLLYLDLFNNMLSGQIPPELAQRVARLNLIKLNLSSNSLSGKIPHVFDNKEFNLSFLDNPKLCSDKQISNFPRCSSSHHRIVAIIIIPGTIIFLISLYFIFFKACMGRQEEPQPRDEQQAWELKPFHRIDFTEKHIVSGLTDNNIIGYGGSGKVYRIVVNDSGDKVAVKRIWNGRKLEDALERQFLTEVEILSTFRHANIVKLLCCVSSANVKLLVYEYMERQSLDKWLGREKGATELSSMHSQASTSSPNPNIVLDWPRRLNIAAGAAKALCYLHHDCSPPIIHRDVKSSNILLDSEFNVKIADFGLAKLTIKSGEPHTASAVAGSFGYIAPEYWRTQRLNEKIDIYSFGVVLLELATGKHPCKGNDHLNLADWSWQQYCEEHPIIDALDKDIAEPAITEQMVNVFKLGLMCTSRLPSSRPTMKQVLQLLISFGHNDNHGQTQMVNEE